jgi:hypothetical protein
MIRSAPLLVPLLALSGVALAAETGDMGVGVGVAMAADLPDKVSKEYAKFGPGPSLQIPFRYQVAPLARFRASARFDLGVGSNRVHWEQEVNGEDVTLYSDDHWAMFVAGGLSVGADFLLPVDSPLIPYLGAEGGVAWVGNYHSFSGSTQVLLDPEQNDLDDSSNIDPWTGQLTLLTEVHLGGDFALSEGLDLWVETGYSVAFLNARELRKTPEELNATRDPWGWNTLRIGAGVVFAL